MAITRNQFITGSVQAASSMNVLFSSAVSSGSLIVCHHSIWTNSVANAHFATFTDGVNAGNYTVGCDSTVVGSTIYELVTGYKSNISSGAAASTYRVSANSSAANADRSLVAVQYLGGPFTTGSTGSSNGTSSSPRGPALTASSGPVLFVCCFTSGSTLAINSTINDGAWIATLNAGNASGQLLVAGESMNSSLTQQPTFGIGGSTTWVFNEVLFLGLGAGGAAATGAPWGFCMTGVQ